MLPLIVFSFILLQQVLLVSGRSNTNLLSKVPDMFTLPSLTETLVFCSLCP